MMLYPSKGLFTIKGLEEDSKITVFNMLGEVVYHGGASETEQIDLSYLAKGVYVLKVNGAVEKVSKLIIE
jgi:hypothetical protein